MSVDVRSSSNNSDCSLSKFPDAIAKGVFLPTFWRNMTSIFYPAAIGRRVGCHTCGVRRARFHADHMPPNAVVKRARDSLWYRLPFVSLPKQRFFPQCHQCSARQAQAVRSWSKALCFHVGSIRVYHATGFFIPPARSFAKNK